MATSEDLEEGGDTCLVSFRTARKARPCSPADCDWPTPPGDMP